MTKGTVEDNGCATIETLDEEAGVQEAEIEELSDEEVEQAIADQQQVTATQEPMLLRGVHIAGTALVFNIGQNNIRTIAFGDAGNPGIVMVRVVYTGTRKARVFMVPTVRLITEFEPQALLLPPKPEIIIPGRE